MKVFPGFPAGKIRATPLPDIFFAQLLPDIDSLAELKVTLHLLWALHRHQGYPRAISEAELLGDGTLLASLRGVGPSPQESLLEGLDKATSRGSLLRLETSEGTGALCRWYAANTAQGRELLEAVREGKVQLGGKPATAPSPEMAERPNIFQLYEQNIGLLQPIIAEELIQAQKDYPNEWIEEAFALAAKANARNWRYIARILERWATQGKDRGKPEPDTEEEIRKRYLGGKYAEYIKH